MLRASLSWPLATLRMVGRPAPAVAQTHRRGRSDDFRGRMRYDVAPTPRRVLPGRGSPMGRHRPRPHLIHWHTLAGLGRVAALGATVAGKKAVPRQGLGPGARRQLTARGPSLISRANSCAGPNGCSGFWRFWGTFSHPAWRDQRRIRREADLSTEQARAQAPSRLPRAHGDQRRPQGCGGPARAWT